MTASRTTKERGRARLRSRIRRLLAKWEPVLGVRVNGWSIVDHEDLGPYLASVDVDAATIRFCDQLAGRSLDFVEFTVVHELAHLLLRGTRGHPKRFRDTMDLYLPSWRRYDIRHGRTR